LYRTWSIKTKNLVCFASSYVYHDCRSPTWGTRWRSWLRHCAARPVQMTVKSSSIRWVSTEKQSICRPGRALRFPEDWVLQISSQSAHEGRKVVSSTHRLSLPPRIYSWYSFLLEYESAPGPYCNRKD
jgi:hypothetical protein